jgi:hypothetical protein
MRTVVKIPAEASTYLAACGDLEAISSGLGKGRDGMTMMEALKLFLQSSRVSQLAQEDSEASEEHSALMAERLFAFLRANEFDGVELLACKGFSQKLVKASPFIEEGIRHFGHDAVARDLIHFVVKIGNIVIDLGFKRFGDNYLHSNNAVFNAFKRMWKTVDLVPPANSQRQRFLGYVRHMVNNTDLKKRFDKMEADKKQAAGAPAKDEHGFAVTAGAVVAAFNGAKRQRKLRGVERDGKQMKITI